MPRPVAFNPARVKPANNVSASGRRARPRTGLRAGAGAPIGQNRNLLGKLGIFLALLGFASCLFISLNPVDEGTAIIELPILRVLPNVLMLASLPLLIVGRMFDARVLSRPVLGGLALGVTMVAGSIAYAYGDQRELSGSFILRGVSLFSLLPGAIIAFAPTVRLMFAQMAIKVGVVAGGICLAMLALHTVGLILPELVQLLKVETSFLIAAPVYVIVRYRIGIAAVALGLFLVALGALIGKATFSLVGLTVLSLYFGRTLLAGFWTAISHLSSARRGLMVTLILPMAFAIFAALVGAVYFVIERRLSLRENDVRLRANHFRLEQFYDSPLFGKGFALSSNVADVMGFGIYVPSHNDVLDILAGGGLIAFALFALCVLPAIVNRVCLRAFLDQRRVLAPEVYFYFVVLFSLVAAIGNPMLSRSNIAVLVWFSVGFVLGLSRYASLVRAGRLPPTYPGTAGQR